MIYQTFTAKTQEELERQMKEWQKQYHPAGYGTSWDGKPIFYAGRGVWERRGSRYSSCE